MHKETKPRIALIPGDPSGIGPELTAKLLADPEVPDRADIVVIGGERVIKEGIEIAGECLGRTLVENGPLAVSHDFLVANRPHRQPCQHQRRHEHCDHKDGRYSSHFHMFASIG